MIQTIGKTRGADIAQILTLARDLQMSVAGCSSGYLFRRLLQDHDVITLVERSEDGAIAGYVLALVDPARYWKRLCWQHPLLAMKIFFDRSTSRRAAGKEPQRPGLPEDISSRLDCKESPEHWGDSGPDIAQILFVGTHPACRGAGIAQKLYTGCFEELRKRGVMRVDACMSYDNLSSLRLHLATGWELRYQDEHVFATKRLHPATVTTRP